MGINHISFAKKLIFGFAATLILLIVVSGLAYHAMFNASKGFKEYREMARDTNLAGRLQANMLMVRMNVKDYLITHSEKDLNQFEYYKDRMESFLKESQIEIQNPERAQKIDTIDTDYQLYRKGFYEVVSLIKKRDRIVRDVLDVKGPAMVNELDTIMQTIEEYMKSAKISPEKAMRIEYLTGESELHIMSARLFMTKFLDTNSDEHMKGVIDEFKKADKYMKELNPLLSHPTLKQSFENAQKAKEAYIDTFKELTDSILKRNNIIKNTLDRIGPEIAKLSEDVKLSIKSIQDEIGPRLQATNQRDEILILSISLLAIFGSVIMVYFLVTSIMKQLGNDPAQIANIAKSIAQNNLNIDFNSGGKRKEGVYKDMEMMTETLRLMLTDMMSGVETLSSSSEKLSNISQQMSAGVEQTTQKSNKVAMSSERMSSHMNSVAAAMEQASTNVGMVATATEEMTATVSEIAKNSEKANSISQSAVSQANNASDKVSELGKAANDIGKVVETITEISEQVNLLALNATIEAARAGEAGKGFAVVANEIKDLASQTAAATMEIKQKIGDIQKSTNGTVTEIKTISEVIHEVNEIVTTIATAVEEQTATTSEIAANVAQASEGIMEISEKVHESSNFADSIATDIKEVNQASEDMKKSSTQVSLNSDDVSTFSRQLKDIVSKFEI